MNHKRSTGVAVWLAFGAAALMAWSSCAEAGSGAGGRRLTHQLCIAGPTCTVTVDYAKPAGGGSNCRVKVPDVVIVRGAVDTVEWVLAAPAGGGAATHRFHADRVKFDDNDTSETATPSGEPNFIDQAAQPQVDKKTLAPRAKRRAKVFTYTVSLEWNDGGTWKACTPLDPMMVNGE